MNPEFDVCTISYTFKGKRKTCRKRYYYIYKTIVGERKSIKKIRDHRRSN